MAKKIKYGLKNVHYAVVTETTVSGVTTSTYGPVKAWPGAVNLSLEAQGEDSNFYADDSVYFTLGNNSGYQGDFESALVPEDVEVNVLGQSKDTNGVIIETSDDVKKYIAIMFEFQMDASGRRYCFYRCSLSRHTVASATKEDTAEPQTDTVTLTATPRPDDNRVKAYVDKDAAAYSNWYSAVYTGGTLAPAVVLNTHYVSMGTTDTYTLTADTTPAGKAVAWSTSDSSVCEVANGVITPAAAGDAIITATITEGGVDYSDTCTVVVAS